MTLPSLSQRLALVGAIVVALFAVASPARAAQFTSIAPGLNHTCAVKADNTAWCWGEGRQGQVGVIGAQRPRTPVYVIGSYQTKVISSSQTYWCGLLLDATVSCTGRGAEGQLGYGSTVAAQFPQEVALPNVTKVATGVVTACAIHDAGLVSCWGDGSRGQLGDGQLRQTPTPSPVAVPGLSGIVDIDVGDSHVCAVRNDGRVLCWGDTADGKLGDGSTAAITIPKTTVTGLTNVATIAVGDRHSCAMKRDGSVWCWGNNTNGQLGLGTSEPDGVSNGQVVKTSRHDRPEQVPALLDAVQIDATGLTSCAVKRGGTAVCWGDGTSGQIGNGVRGNALSPQPVSGITDAKQLGIGSQHACLVTKTNAPFCWGRNLSGQLGSGEPYSHVALRPELVQDFILGPASFLPASVAGLPAGSTAGGVLQFKALQISRRSGTRCPKRASLRVSARGKTSVKRVTIIRVNNGCGLTGRYTLPKSSQNATKASYRISGDNLRTKSDSLRPRQK
ncbi:MAG: hypothetical protein Q7T71_15770 [Herbiconiux sp.]|nr:hypothetical protein [Herbiconiux sp.]